jgi:hypothetical protein
MVEIVSTFFEVARQIDIIICVFKAPAVFEQLFSDICKYLVFLS